jgi:hypothetical protein
MEAFTIVGVLLIAIAVGIAIGVGTVAYQGITTNGESADNRPFDTTRRTERPIPLPAIVGGLALASGIIFVIIGTKKS